MQQPYQPVPIYDAPDVIIGQLLEGSLSPSSIARAIAQPDRLGPAERFNWTNDLKLQTGGNPLVNTFIDVATNPFIIASFLLTPAGGKAVSSAFGGAATGAAKTGQIFGNYLKRTPLPAALMTGIEMMRGTPASPLIESMTQSMTKLRGSFFARAFGDAVDAVPQGRAKSVDYIKTATQKFGITEEQFENTRLITNPALRDRVKRVKYAMYLSLTGLDKPQSGFIFEMKKKAGWTPTILQSERVRKPMLAEGVAERVLKEGDGVFWKIREQIRDATLERLAQNYMKDGVTVEQLRGLMGKDPNKLADLVDHNKLLAQYRNSFLPTGSTIGRGPGGLMGDDMIRRVKAKEISMEQWEDAIRKEFASRIELDSYLPRNTAEFYTAVKRPRDVPEPFQGRGPASYEFVPSGVRRAREDEVRRSFGDNAITTSGRIMPTSRGPVELWDPENIEDIGRVFEGQLGDGFVGARKRAAAIELGLNPRDPAAASKIRDLFDTEDELKKFLREASQNFEEGVVRVNSMDHLRGLNLYNTQTARDYALSVMVPDEVTKEAVYSMFRQIGKRPGKGMARYPEERGVASSWMTNRGFGSKSTVSLKDIFRGTDFPMGGWKNQDVVELTRFAASEFKGPHAGKIWGETLVQVALGLKHTPSALRDAVYRTNQAIARNLVQDGTLFRKVLDSMGETGQRWRARFEEIANDDLLSRNFNISKRWSLTGHLYASHLGLNMGTIALNLTQPFLHLGTIATAQHGPVKGAGMMLGAYKDALVDLAEYTRIRLDVQRNPLKQLSSVELARVLSRSKRLQSFDAAGITGDTLADFDNMIFNPQSMEKATRARRLLIDLPLKPFEKTEWLNRLVSVHYAKRTGLAGGLIEEAAGGWVQGSARNRLGLRPQGAMEEFNRQARELAFSTQFGANVMNTPTIFLENKLLAEPLLRQFLTFPTRTITAFATVPGQLVGRENSGMLAPIVGDLVRALAVSSVAYEMFKPTGLELSRGLIQESFGLVDVERFFGSTDRTLPIPNPPVLSIPTDLIRGVWQGDLQFVANAFARMVPGGVAGYRALQTSPQAFFGMDPNLREDPVLGTIPVLRDAQRTYADWNAVGEDGLIPVYRSDGTLLDRQNPFDLFMRGVGIPLQSHRQAQRFDRYLMVQRQEMLEMKAKAMSALEMGNVGKAESIARQYQKRFGIPLKISEAQVRNRAKTREAVRTERLLDMLPAEARIMYQEMAAAGDTERFGLEDPQSLVREAVASRRERVGPDLPVGPQDPEAAALLRKFVEQENQNIQIQERSGYQPFTPF